MAFACWAKGFAALADLSFSCQSTGSDNAMDVDGIFTGRKLLQMTLMLFVVQAGIGGTSTMAPEPVGIEKIQKCLIM